MAHRHLRDRPCHFSLMSLAAWRRALLAGLPIGLLWLAVLWAGGWLG
ncbi:hypothetical protein [Halotalea alkalilenta]|nr:hypothetical protein [Halotalea alkalilenta]